MKRGKNFFEFKQDLNQQLTNKMQVMQEIRKTKTDNANQRNGNTEHGSNVTLLHTNDKEQQEIFKKWITSQPTHLQEIVLEMILTETIQYNKAFHACESS